MSRPVYIFNSLFLLVTLVSALFLTPAPLYAQGHYRDTNRSYSQYQLAPEEAGPQRGQLPIKKWLMLFGTLSGFALLLLIIFEIGGGGLLPDTLEDMIAKVCACIIAITLWLYLYYLSSKIVFIILIPITITLILFIYLRPIFKRLYRKSFGQPSSPAYWVCRKCGTENSKLLTECDNCHTLKKADRAEPVGDTWICSNCDYKNQKNDKNCGRCGTRREGE